MNENYQKYFEQKISWHKLILSLLFATAAGSLGWFVNHFDALLSLKILSLLGFAASAFGISYCFSKARYYIKKTGEIK